MIDLIKYVIGTFADDADSAVYEVEEDGNVVSVTVLLKPSDMGKVIGKGGKLAKAIRTLLKVGGQKENKKYNLEIKEQA